MSVAEIQRSVEELPVEERRRLTTWMATHHPILDVADLLEQAAKMAKSGSWVPTPPTSINEPAGQVREHASNVAKALDLG